MLSAHLSDLLTRRIVLGSASPRRKEILEKNLGLEKLDVVVSSFPETLNKSLYSPIDYVQSTCLGKTYEILGRVPAILNEDRDILICADTCIELDSRILEKPSSPEDAIRMLQSLSGQTHLVHTAVSISTISEQRNFVESTSVTFDELPLSVIEAYVATGDPMDKAGSYGYQSGGASLILSIAGCYYNVVGFPANRFSKELIAMLEDNK